MSFEDNWDSAQDKHDEPQTEFAPLPEGTYCCKLLSVSSEPNPNDDILRTTLELEVQGEEHNGRRIWEKVKQADNLMWKAVQLFAGMGLEGKVNSWQEWADIMKTKIGCEFEVTTQNRTYDDKVYPGVKRIKVDDPVPF